MTSVHCCDASPQVQAPKIQQDLHRKLDVLENDGHMRSLQNQKAGYSCQNLQIPHIPHFWRNWKV